MSARERCGYAVTDRDGQEEPCDRPATGWRWYQDVGEHEDLLDVACDLHANEGGRRIAAAQKLAMQRDVPLPDRFKFGATENYIAGYRAALRDLGDALAGEVTA